MYRRSFYLKKITPFIGKPLIKILTGMRRVGKSYFLKQFKEHLITNGTNKHKIVYIDKESLEFDFIKNYKDLNSYVKDSLKKGGCVLIDEVQDIEDWEKAIASLNGEGFDIYLTGSNAHFLSSELSTRIAGRYIRFDMFPLCFEEYIEFNKIKDVSDGFSSYLKNGGLPALQALNGEKEVITQYFSSLYDTILVKDIITRYNVRNVGLFSKISHYLFDNVGSIFSGKSIVKYLKAQRLSVGLDTIHNYLEYLCNAFVFYKVPRYDIRGKRILELYEKYYMGDIGLRHALAGQEDKNIAGLLENIVFLELQKRGYEVSIGHIDQLEIDFIAKKENSILYIQVAWKISSEACLERELKPLKKIKDQYPKYLLTMDKDFYGDFEGIKPLNLVDFLRTESL